MIVDRLEVLCLDAVPEDVGILLGAPRHITDEILDKDGVGVGALGHKLFIRALEQTVEFAAGGVLHQSDHFLDPHRLGAANGIGHMAALVMGTGLADGLGAGAEGRDWNDHRHDEVDLPLGAAGERGAKADRVVEQANRPCDRSRLLKEVGELEVDVSLVALQALGELHKDVPDITDMEDGPVGVQRLHEAAHVRPLEVMGEIDRQLDRGDGGLLGVALVPHADRVAQILHSDAVDRDLAIIGKVLGVGKVCGHKRKAVGLLGQTEGIITEKGFSPENLKFQNYEIPSSFSKAKSPTVQTSKSLKKLMAQNAQAVESSRFGA